MKLILVPAEHATGDNYTHPTFGPGTLSLVGDVTVHSQSGKPMFRTAVFEAAPEVPAGMVPPPALPKITGILVRANSRAGGVSIVPLSYGCIALPTVGVTVYHQSHLEAALKHIRLHAQVDGGKWENVLTHPLILALPRE